MSEEVKFNEEEMKELKSIQETYLEVQNNLGQTQNDIKHYKLLIILVIFLKI